MPDLGVMARAVNHRDTEAQREGLGSGKGAGVDSDEDKEDEDEDDRLSGYLADVPGIVDVVVCAAAWRLKRVSRKLGLMREK